MLCALNDAMYIIQHGLLDQDDPVPSAETVHTFYISLFFFKDLYVNMDYCVHFV